MRGLDQQCLTTTIISSKSSSLAILEQERCASQVTAVPDELVSDRSLNLVVSAPTVRQGFLHGKRSQGDKC